jgi:Rad3-related DNA helicase
MTNKGEKMSIQKKREEIYNHVADNLFSNYENDTIAFYECPTGSGKTAIILKSAYDLMKKYNKSVIISTSSNELAQKFLTDGAQDIKNFYNTDISENEIQLILGKTNFVDIETIEFFIKSDIKTGFENISLEDVQKWYEDKKNMRLVENFIKDFDIKGDNAKYIALSSEDDTDEVATIKNFPKFLEQENKIYITNHLFLITLIEVLAHNPSYQEFKYIAKETPIFLDEAHSLTKLASLKYRSDFSAFRLRNLFQELTKDKKLAKDKRVLKEDIEALFRNTINTKTTNEKFGSNTFNYHIEELEEFFTKYKTNFGKIISKISYENKKEKTINKFLKREFYELSNIFYSSKKEKMELKYSDKKGFLTISLMKKDPKFELRRNFWTATGNVTLFSGTYRIDVEHTTPNKNQWTFAQLGLFKFNNPENTDQELLTKKVATNIKFKVFKWLFPKENFLYTIVDNEKLQNVSSSKYDKKETEMRKRERIKNLAQFYCGYYKDSLFKDSNTLFLMGSYQESNMLAEEINKHIDSASVFFETETETTGSLLGRYISKANKSKGNILIGTLTFFTGINLKGDLCGTIIMAKLPYGPFSWEMMKNKYDVAGNSYRLSYKNSMILLFRQGIGRASRTEDDKAVLFILDNRIEKLESKKNGNAKLKGFLKEMGTEFDFEEDFKSKYGYFI